MPDHATPRTTRSHVALACRTEDKLRKYVPGLQPIHCLQLETAIAKHTRSTAGGSATEIQASQKPIEEPPASVHVLDPKGQEIGLEKRASVFAASRLAKVAFGAWRDQKMFVLRPMDDPSCASDPSTDSSDPLELDVDQYVKEEMATMFRSAGLAKAAFTTWRDEFLLQKMMRQVRTLAWYHGIFHVLTLTFLW